jgi:hypothetical protein
MITQFSPKEDVKITTAISNFANVSSSSNRKVRDKESTSNQEEHIIMGQQINQFCETLRVKLTNIDSNFDKLKTKIDRNAKHAEEEVHSHLENLQQRIERDHEKVLAAKAEVKDWAESRKIDTEAKIADWKAKHETSKLQKRADKAERYAAAAVNVAMAAVDEAEQAALEAWLARQDANVSQPAKAY